MKCIRNDSRQLKFRCHLFPLRVIKIPYLLVDSSWNYPAFNINWFFLSVIANSSKRKITRENKHWPCLWRLKSLICWARFACQTRQCFDCAALKSILRLATLRFDYALTKFALYAVFSITFPRVAYIMIGYERRCKLLSIFHLLIFKRKKKD